MNLAQLDVLDPSRKLMMLPSDLVLIEDPVFKKYVGMVLVMLFDA